MVIKLTPSFCSLFIQTASFQQDKCWLFATRPFSGFAIYLDFCLIGCFDLFTSFRYDPIRYTYVIKLFDTLNVWITCLLVYYMIWSSMCMSSNFSINFHVTLIGLAHWKRRSLHFFGTSFTALPTDQDQLWI